MSFPTHFFLGLIIGKATGQYVPALAGSILIDGDHVISYLRHHEPAKDIIHSSLTGADPNGDHRGMLHNVIVCGVISVVAVAFFGSVGFAFALAYIGHLILDILCHVRFYPFQPNRSISTVGPIRYNSLAEWMFAAILLLIFLFM